MSEEKKEKVKVKIQGREYEFDKQDVIKISSSEEVSIASYKKKYKITFKIGDIENKDITFKSILINKNNNINHIFIEETEKITFKIGDIQNKDKKVSQIHFYKNGNINYILLNQPENITFKIGHIYNIKSSTIYFNIDGTIKQVNTIEKYTDFFFYDGKKYKLTFCEDEYILFKSNGELNEDCINNSNERQNVILKEKNNTLKNENNTLKQINESLENAKSYSGKAIKCFGGALAWFVLINLLLYPFLVYFCNNVYDIYVDDVFKFLQRIIINLPAIILCYVGIKFLNLFVFYKTEAREIDMLDSYLDKIKSQDKKDELTKQLATHFFPDKKSTKISQNFLQELMLKMVDKKQEN